MNALTELKSFIEKVNKNPEHIENEKDRVFQFDLTDAGSIQIEFKEGRAHLYEEVLAEADVVLKLSEKHLLRLLANDLNTTMAFMTGQLKVAGKMGLALKLQEIVKTYQAG
ncbi:SCP2 sterol-binding domain-containing protein [Halalkalibacter alkalisediminis]|uniref:SCP2 sterol-binding domain-containing protein n=1 Tax=Halalkalibacter alkalisediminis TaxID=935616 RepID=A0ABV6NFU8_9BACI|nr:SCP2 sterol-binding domain-containing protein [Halalkalibacter alkalisediminis]